MEKKALEPYIAVTDREMNSYIRDNSIILNQAFKGEVADTPVMIKRGLGAAHPFDFQEIEKINSRIGLINGASSKITDSIMGDFTITVEDANAQALIDDFVHDSNLTTVVRTWIHEAVLKGNGFMELDLPNSRVRVMNANSMYVVRSKTGKVLRYNQFTGQHKAFNFSKDKDKVIPFAENQIAHLPLNKVPNDPYGIGYVWPSLVAINNYSSAELDLHKLMSRKAGAPYHVKLGEPGESVNPEAIDAFKQKLQYMTNTTEWVTDGNVEMKIMDFAGTNENLIQLSEHDIEQIAYGMQIPLVMLGKANIPEGLAKTQEATFRKFIDSVRTIIEDVMEEKVIRPMLRAQNQDAVVKFTWELPAEVDKVEKLRMINEALKNPFLSQEMKAALEIQYAEIAELDSVLEILKSPKDAQKEAKEEKEKMDKEMDANRKKEEETIKQPEVPGAKPTAKQSAKPELKEHVCDENCGCTLTEAEAGNMTLAEYVNITEMPGFQYTDYLIKILQKLKTYEFKELAATNMEEVARGLLPEKDIAKLRVVLGNGFKKNKTIRQIEKEIAQTINLKDRTILEDGVERVTLSAEARPNAIARTETVRLANAGLIDLYQENDIKQYRYLAALDDRTSEICTELNGQVFNVKDGQPGNNMPPMHTNCRSTIVGLVD